MITPTFKNAPISDATRIFLDSAYEDFVNSMSNCEWDTAENKLELFRQFMEALRNEYDPVPDLKTRDFGCHES